MARNFFVISLTVACLLSSLTYLSGGDAKAGGAASSKVVQTILFPGGSCKLDRLNTRPMFSPAEMKESEKAFMVELKCALTGKSSDDALRVLYDKGEFVAPDGKRYRAGAAIFKSDETIYRLVVAIPQNVDVEKLRFIYDGQVLPLGK
ncbi:MAG TPA: hypothetical protein DEB25_00075 [Desulfobulbaceae bacterium]|nr:hypothetical protein [Desulfobulbaceae bacterium]